MRFDNALHMINEASQATVTTLNKMEEYFDNGGFRQLYPKIWKKYFDHVRRENYMYKKKDGTYFALLIVLKSKTYDEDKDNVVKIIKDLEVIKDNKCKVTRNGIIIKIMMKDIVENINKESK
jgi:hypothetical protein